MGTKSPSLTVLCSHRCTAWILVFMAYWLCTSSTGYKNSVNAHFFEFSHESKVMVTDFDG